MKKGSYWLMLLALIFVVAAGGCGGGGGSDSGNPDVPSVPDTTDVLDGNWIDVADTSWYSSYKTEFTISTAAQLAGLAKIVNGTDALEDNFKGKTIRLVSDINLADREWTPIGDDFYSSFNGTFNGGGGIISNLAINRTEESNDAGIVGLFGYNNGTLRDIHLANVNVSFFASSSSITSSGGGLVGSNDGTIENCTVSGNVSSPYSTGGLVGSNNGTIENCTVSGNASSSFFSSSDYLYFTTAGGLVGTNSGTIEGCTATSNVSSSSPPNGCSAGGFVGENNGIIESCTASGNVSSSFSASAGGFAGSNMGTIEGCTARGKNISVSAANGADRGGFIGWNGSWNGSRVSLNNNRNETGVTPAIGMDTSLNPPAPNNNI